MNIQTEQPLLTLLRQSPDVEIVGDVHVEAASPHEFGRWCRLLSQPVLFGWRSTVTGRRHLQLQGDYAEHPLHGCATVLLDGDHHRHLWVGLVEGDLGCGDERPLDVDDLLQRLGGPRLLIRGPRRPHGGTRVGLPRLDSLPRTARQYDSV